MADWTRAWKPFLKNLLEEGVEFGHNCWDDSKETMRRFTKLEELGAEIHILTDIHNGSPYNIRVFMPSNFIGKMAIASDLRGKDLDGQVAMFILTKMPAASSATMKKIKREGVPMKCLDLEWHW